MLLHSANTGSILSLSETTANSAGIRHVNIQFGIVVEGKDILQGLNLTVNPGEVHAIMGPNGSGKSTLANVLAGREEYESTGEVLFDGEDISLKCLPKPGRAKACFWRFNIP